MSTAMGLMGRQDQQPHALVLPYPAQGHVIPFMELSHCLVDRGFRVTFVNTEFNHRRILSAHKADEDATASTMIRQVPLPDGLGPEEDRNQLGRLTAAILQVMPGHLEELIRKSREPGGHPITCAVVDGSMGWAIEVGKRMGLRTVGFFPASAGTLSVVLNIPKLMEAGIIDADGYPTMKELKISVGTGLPTLDPTHLSWNYLGDAESQRIVFDYCRLAMHHLSTVEVIGCNSIDDIERSIFLDFPRISPVGPLLANRRQGKPVGHFWPEDSACADWLDRQAPGSVVYVAFGSFTILDPLQFQELAFGLELSGRPFLWVVRPDLTRDGGDAFPPGFKERVAGRGMMVGWSPQEKVLAHPSVACFMSHCGWNSTMEAVWNGVPLICWPYFADQFLNRDYVCETWRNGLGLEAGSDGIVSREEIKGKVERILGDEGVKKKAAMLRDVARKNVQPGGRSSQNFDNFVEVLKRV